VIVERTELSFWQRLCQVRKLHRPQTAGQL
jgi:hypothetical protein